MNFRRRMVKYRWWRRWAWPSLVAIPRLLPYVTAITLLIGGILWIRRQIEAHGPFDWRPAEYQKLESLRVWRQVPKVRAEFGPPAYRQFGTWQRFAGKLPVAAEYFQGREYWLQVISAGS